MNDESMKDFKHWCLLNVTAFAKQLGASDRTSFYITQSWLNYTNEKQVHYPHSHPNSIISGVYYINANPKFDYIRFKKRGISSSNKRNPSNWTAVRPIQHRITTKKIIIRF